MPTTNGSANGDVAALVGDEEFRVQTTTTTVTKKRVHAELTPQQDEGDQSMGDHHHNNVGVGRVTRSRARAQQQQQQQSVEEDSFEVPGLMNTRRGGPPNKVARRK